MTAASRIEARFRAASSLLGGLVALLSAAVLAGWMFGVAGLTAAWAGSATMKPNTAAALAFAGLALCSEALAGSSRWRIAGRVLASLCVAVGVLTLCQYVFAISLGVDSLLVFTPQPALSGDISARMAPNTAVCLASIGSALAIGEPPGRRLRWLAHALALFVLAIAFVAVAGYAYSATALYGVAGFESMALSTSLGLAALSLGTLLCRPRDGVTRLIVQQNVSGATLRRLLPVLALGPFAIGWMRLQGQRAGWYGTEFGVGVLVTASTAVLCAVALWSARAQGRAEQSLEQARRDQLFSLQLSELLRAAEDPSAVLFETASALCEHLGASRALFIEVEVERDRVIFHPDHRGGELPSIAGDHPLSGFDVESLGQARSGRTLVSADTRSDPHTAPRYETTYEPLALRARILVPLFRGARWVGGLVVGSDQPRSWQKREIDLVELAAARAWEWSERLRADEQLRLIIEESPLGNVLVDGRGHITYVNRRAEQMFGYSRNELLGLPVELLVPPALRARHDQQRTSFAAAPRTRAMSTGRPLLAARRDDTVLPVEIELTALQSSGGGLVLASIMDVTARVTAEQASAKMMAELERMNAELEQRVRMRTEQLSRALADRGVLLQEIHHRVKNNLQVISSLLRMQARRLSDGPSRSALKDCEGRVGTISLIHETLYRAEDYDEVPFAEYVRSLIMNVFRAHGAAQEQVNLVVAVDPVALQMDKAIPCGLILNELISNALKHGFPDSRPGEVRVELRERAGRVVLLSVSDDGVGGREDESPETKSLGMQLVRALADQLGATLDIVRGRGTTVRIEFPTQAAG